ncbi:hypothetical protein [Streptomyces sp. NPDC050504]|uniref:hypothetical protein n=1 Tax=Streptomyces sp. NPDC050504 TaxID=3365618 RepID=UPI0037B82432
MADQADGPDTSGGQVPLDGPGSGPGQDDAFQVSNSVSGTTAHGPIVQAGSIDTFIYQVTPPPAHGEMVWPVRVGAVPDRAAPGQPISEWEPHQLEVHPAGPGESAPGEDGVWALPGYVRRAHDRVLADAVVAATAGRSGIVVLVGTSSTGKTRACWEAVQPLAEQGWRLWHPFDPTRAEAALEDLHRVGPRTVVWLNEAHHYFGDRQFGEPIAAAVHQLLIDKERGPVLVLGTLWPDDDHDYTALPPTRGDDPYSRVRELLAGRTLSVPDVFDNAALAAATALAEQGDTLLASALIRNRSSGRITQDLAGAPELLRRYEQPRQAAARALLQAAMDARRFGVGLHLPKAFLTDAALGYLGDDDYEQLSKDWAEQAYAELAVQVHGKQAPLRLTRPRPPRHPSAPTARTTMPPSTGPVLRLADYLEHHGRYTRRHLCPPEAFWNSAYNHLRPESLRALADAARSRFRLRWAHRLFQQAVDHGDTEALLGMAWARERAGDRASAEEMYRRAADHGHTHALLPLALLREEAGDRAGAEALARQAADRGHTDVPRRLASAREKVQDDRLLQQAADNGDTEALRRLALMGEMAGDPIGAETLARQAADRGDTTALLSLAGMRESAGDWASAEVFYRQAAHHGSTSALRRLASMREELGDRASAEELYRQVADRINSGFLRRLTLLREEAGDRAGAEILARHTADRSDSDALYYLGLMRERAGDRAGAEILIRQASDYGSAESISNRTDCWQGLLRRWPHGLDPDGTPTSPWKPPQPTGRKKHAPPVAP